LFSDNTYPKYFQLKEYLKKQMLQGKITCNQKMPSENELAKEFNLSRHTVRHAFRELEIEGWIRREQGRGTFCVYGSKNPNWIIAVVTTYISEYIFPSIIRGIEETISAAGYSMILANTNNDRSKEAVLLESLINQNIAGLIIEPTRSSLQNTNLKWFRDFEKQKIPYIMLHASYSDLEPAYIIMDDLKGGYLATQYLLQLGHREIAGIFKIDDQQGSSRKTGYLSALVEYGVEPRNDLIGCYETEQMHTFPDQFTKNLLQKTPRPTAIVCYNDQTALEVIEVLRNQGLKIPDDISVIGYDDSMLAVASEVKLTTIKHPKFEMGCRAGRLIVDMIEGRINRPTFVYQPELIIRNSCRNLN
jgi:GntR family transcriptional regulator of arabinose operon